MPGHGAQQRAYARARQASVLKAHGLTTREIAEVMNIEPERVKPLLTLAKRLESARTLPESAQSTDGR